MTNTYESTNSTQQRTRRADLVEPDLSYRVVGLLFGVYNELGPGHAERIYQRATAEALRESGIIFREQVSVALEYHGKRIGVHRLDFFIEEKVVLELKQGHRIYRQHIQQVAAYLVALSASLGLLANFGAQDVTFRRIVNLPKRDS